MRKVIRVFLIVLLIVFVVIQFFQPEKNSSDDSSNHFLQRQQVPPDVENLLTNACLDCHSNQTRYVWYNKIAPVSWMVNSHIEEGKKELNFSEWGNTSTLDKIVMLEQICREVERKKMPLKSYQFMHPKAKLSDDQIEKLCAFTTRLSEELLAAEED